MFCYSLISINVNEDMFKLIQRFMANIYELIISIQKILNFEIIQETGRNLVSTIQ